MKTKLVRDMGEEYQFLSDSQNVNHAKEYCTVSEEELKEYDAVFVKIDASGTEYDEIWGMSGIIPGLDKTLYRIF